MVQRAGFELKEVAGLAVCYSSDRAGVIEKYYRPKISLLSKAALETLAIIVTNSRSPGLKLRNPRRKGGWCIKYLAGKISARCG